MPLPPSSDQPASAAVPPSSAGGDPSVLDLRVLQEMVGHEPEVVMDFLQQYLVSARKIMAEVRAGHAAGHLAQIGGATHRLKSSSRAIGALGLGDLCAEIESAANLMHEAEVVASIPPLELAFAAVERAIAHHLGTA